EGRPLAGHRVGEDAVGGVARHHAVADHHVAPAARVVLALHPEADHVVLQVDAVEHHVGADVAERPHPYPGGQRSASIVVDDGVGNKDLAGGGQVHENSGAQPVLEAPDHAILDVDGRGLDDLNPGGPDRLPVDDQAAHAHHVADVRVDGDADAGGHDDARLADAVVGDVHRFADGQLQAEIDRRQDADVAAGHDVVVRLLEAEAWRIDGAAGRAVDPIVGDPDLDWRGRG